jgi:hypothetical protein
LNRNARIALLLAGILVLILTAGFSFQWSAATSLWPWPDSRLSYIFIASILAAIAVPVIWIGLSGETGATVGGSLNLCLASGASAIYLFQLYAGGGEHAEFNDGLVLGIFAVAIGSILGWGLRHPIQDPRPMPPSVRISFAAFTAILILVGLALVLKAPVIFPWSLNPDSSVIFGWVFLGAALYFLYGTLRPSWHNARGQLMGFLAYDLILVGPFLAHLIDVQPEQMLSLILYLIVIFYSGGLAVYYLLINQQTRTWVAPTE